MNVRPAYIDTHFRGGCKIFPAATTDGREPILLSYQAKWRRDRARVKGAEKSRQIGWSWAEAYTITCDTSLDTNRLDHWVSSRDDIQARLFLNDVKMFTQLLKIGANDLGMVMIDEKAKISSRDIEFANGCAMHSMSSNPDAQAGKRGGRTLDEAALHKEFRRLFAIARPGITWGGTLSFFSTHRGSANYFNELVNEVRHKGNPKRISLHRVTLQDALDAGFLYKLQKKLLGTVENFDDLDPDTQRLILMDEAEYFDDVRAGCPDEESFLEEYMCVPSDDEGAFLSFDLIDGCALKGFDDLVNDSAYILKTPKGARCLVAADWKWRLGDDCYLGIDIGRKKDLTVLWLNQKIAGIHLPRLVIELDRVPFSQQEAVLHEVYARFQPRRVCIDASGIGAQFAERGQERFGQYRIEAVVFTPAVKEELAFPVRSAFEDKSIRVPNDKLIIADLRQLRKETTASNNIRFTAERTKDGHADRFWALALALHAAKNATGPFMFRPLSEIRARADAETSFRRPARAALC